jgi:hypothetical protein
MREPFHYMLIFIQRTLMIRILITAAFVIGFSEVTAAVTLYSQTPNFADYGGGTSVDPLPITADDFTPTSIWQISAATFQGAWADDFSVIPPGATTRGFRIQFYRDNAGQPSDVPLEEFNAVATLGNPRSHDKFTVYDLSVVFPTTRTFLPATSYWFAVVDLGPGGGAEGFFWSGSDEGNDRFAQKLGAGWERYTDQNGLNGDLGFSLIGTAIPEPTSSSLAHAAMFIACSAIVLRRNRRDPRPSRQGL